MRVRVVVFHLRKGTPTTKHREFHRAVYGLDTSSWGGRYKYRLRGVLDEVPYVKLYRGVVLVSEDDFPALERMLRAFSAEYTWREIKPLKADLDQLSGASH
jgi:hypothetical protein